MTTATATRKARRSKVETTRSCRIAPRPGISQSVIQYTLTLTYTTGEKVESTEYVVTAIKEGYLLENQTNGKSYRTVLSGDVRFPKCTCLGHKHHNHCKHHESLTALKNAGKL